MGSVVQIAHGLELVAPDNLYRGMNDHDLLISLNTKFDVFVQNQDKIIDDMKKANMKNDSRITACFSDVDTKDALQTVRYDKLKNWSPFWAAIGGAVGAVTIALM